MFVLPSPHHILVPRISFPALAGALVAMLAVPLLGGQSASPSPVGAVQAPSPSFRVNARLVVLDLVVTDKAGAPVEGLTAGDFKVWEQGQPQRIRSFEPPAAHALPSAPAAASPAAGFDPAQPASFGNAPVTLLILDQINTHFADSSFARRALRDYLAAQPALLAQPTTLLTVYDDHFKLLQAFTRDRDALLRALAAAPVKYAWKLEVNGKTEYGPVERLDQSLRALEQIAQSYGRIPGRKNLLWVGGGFPTIDPGVIDGDDAAQVKSALQHITNVLLDNRVTLYAVDPASSAAGMTEITDTTQMDFLEAAGDGLSANFDPFDANRDFDRLGPVTGGRVVRGANDVAQQMGAMVDAGSHYYTLSYAPTATSEAAAQFRNIRVVCLRPGVTVATRSGYYSGDASEALNPATAAYDLTTAAEASIPLNDIRVQVEAPAPGARTYLVRAGAGGLTWKANEDGSDTASVYIMAVSLDAKGKMLDHTLHGMTATARPSVRLNDPGKMADFSFPVQPADKAATLRFVVRDKVTGHMGSFDLALKAR